MVASLGKRSFLPSSALPSWTGKCSGWKDDDYGISLFRRSRFCQDGGDAMTPLRAKIGIDDYSWRAFRELREDSQDEILLFLETLSPDFEKHPERWGPCFSMLSRDFRTAQRWLDAAITEAREREANR